MEDVKIKSSLYSRYYAEACNKWRIHLRGLTAGQRRNVAAVAATVSDLTSPGMEPKTSRANVLNHYRYSIDRAS